MKVRRHINQLNNDVLEESSRVFNQDFVSKDGQDSEVLLAENSTEVLPDLSKESMNDDLKLDSSSSFNTPAEQQESYSNENSTREIEEISETIQVKKREDKEVKSRGIKNREVKEVRIVKEVEEEKKEQGEKKSRFGWFKKRNRYLKALN